MSYGIFQFRRDTAANWTSANPVLLSGELALETDTSLFKIGDGTTAWNSLSYGGLVGATGPTGPSGTSGMHQSYATVTFGSVNQTEHNTTVTVSNSSIQLTSQIIASVAAVATADHSSDEVMIEDIVVSAGNIVAGVSFDINAYCSLGTYGQYQVNYLITY